MTTSNRPYVLHTRVVTGNGGGPEKTILNSPRFLANYGIDSACLFMHPPEDPGMDALRSRGHATGAEVIGVADKGPFDLSVVKSCLRICRERNVDVWHAHDYKSNALGLLLNHFYPMKLVTTAHGWVKFTSKTPLYYAIDRFCMKRYDQVVCVSQDLFDRCEESGIATDRLTMIDNAIVTTDYDPSPSTTAERHAAGVDNEDLVLGAVGRLSPEKGFHHLITAVHRLRSEGLRVSLLIAGEGDQKAELQKLIDELQLQSSVRLIGFLQDPRTLYRAIDVFVLSSLREGLPNVVLEAMASGRAVVTTRVNGIPRLVQNQENGVVVDADSVDTLHAGIRQLVVSEPDRQTFAEEGRRTVEEQFSFARRMEKMTAVYRSLGGKLAHSVRVSSRAEQTELEPVTA